MLTNNVRSYTQISQKKGNILSDKILQGTAKMVVYTIHNLTMQRVRIIQTKIYCYILGYPFRGFKRIGLELDIYQTKLLNQFFSFQLKI